MEEQIIWECHIPSEATETLTLKLKQGSKLNQQVFKFHHVTLGLQYLQVFFFTLRLSGSLTVMS